MNHLESLYSEFLEMFKNQTKMLLFRSPPRSNMELLENVYVKLLYKPYDFTKCYLTVLRLEIILQMY
jgi:hypothetical protein